MVQPTANTPAAVESAATAGLQPSTPGVVAVGGQQPVQVQSAGNSVSAITKATYDENYWLQDFEVHFLVSLPFTALYSYATVSVLDASVQGKFPTTFSPADMWVVMGLAFGGSLAVALGSINRVPDQSLPRVAGETSPDFSEKAAPLLKVALLQIDY
jgi:hypothetical protein